MNLEITEAVYECSIRGLYTSMAWNSDLLSNITSEPLDFKVQATAVFLNAKSLFDSRDYLRAAYVLRNEKDNRSSFLKLYANYLYLQSNTGYHDENTSGKPNDDLMDLLTSIEAVESKDAFILYLHAAVMIDMKVDGGKEMLLKSLARFPYNWSAWLLLSSIALSVGDVSIELPLTIPHKAFKIYALNELHASPDHILPLIEDFEPAGKFIALQKAILYHNSRDFEESEAMFEKLANDDPFLIDGMDLYSNVLYVRRKYSKLCDLAHRMSRVDRFRPETCVCIGNYYSMKGDRKKAITAFSRAVMLDRSYSPAYTLLGHEYVDSCLPKQAIEVYRRAIDLNQRDYRAFYGLGQAYDLLQLPSYSIYYHQRALALRPEDGRMWGALAASLEACGRVDEAIRCLKRVLAMSGFESQEFAKVAGLYLKLGNEDQAAFYWSRYLTEEGELEFMSEANLFLTAYNKKKGITMDTQ